MVQVFRSGRARRAVAGVVFGALLAVVSSIILTHQLVQAQPPALTISPDSAPAGDRVAVTGTGFPAEENSLPRSV